MDDERQEQKTGDAAPDDVPAGARPRCEAQEDQPQEPEEDPGCAGPVGSPENDHLHVAEVEPPVGLGEPAQLDEEQVVLADPEAVGPEGRPSPAGKPPVLDGAGRRHFPVRICVTTRLRMSTQTTISTVAMSIARTHRIFDPCTRLPGVRSARADRNTATGAVTRVG